MKILSRSLTVDFTQAVLNILAVFLLFSFLGLDVLKAQIANFNSEDIGTVAVAGSTTCVNGIYTVNGSGTSIGTGTSDSGQFSYQTLVGNGSITTQLESQGAGTASSGIMIRQSMAPGSPEVQLTLTTGTSVTFVARTAVNQTGVTEGTVASSTTPMWLMIIRTGTTFTAYYSANTVYAHESTGSPAASWTLVGSVTISSMSGPLLAGAVECGLGSTLKTATFDSLVVTTGIPWAAQDIGAVGLTGSTSYGAGTYTVNGSGSSMGATGTADSFQYAYQNATGDCTIIARAKSQSGDDSTGIMIRQNATAGSPMVQLTRTYGPTAVLDARTTEGAAASVVGSESAPNQGIYLELVRAGNTFTGYTSYTGPTGPWTQVGTSVTVTMTGPVMIGLVECSQYNGNVKTGVFDNVSVLPWAAQDIGSVGLAGTTIYNYGSYSVSGSGASMGGTGTSDSFQYANQSLSGVVTIIAQVVSQTGGDSTGIMFRENTTAGSPMVQFTVTNGAAVLDARTTSGAAASVIATGSAPSPGIYLELIRGSGNVFTAYTSYTGPNGPWTEVGSVTVFLGYGAVTAGLVECSQNNSVLDTGVFDNVAVLPVTTSPNLATLLMGTTRGMAVPSTFMGLSMEWGATKTNQNAQWMMGTDAITPNLIYRKLLSNLTAYGSGPMNIRIGGDSTDSQGSVDNITAFANLAQDTDAQFEVGINLKTATVTLATNQATSYASQMPAGSLLALEIGNEPDAYPGYTFSSYLTKFQQWTASIQTANPTGPKFMGPSFANPADLYANTPTNIQTFLSATSSTLGVVSFHWYSLSPGNNPAVDSLLENSSAANGPTEVAEELTAAQVYGLPVRMGEFSSADDAGIPGISNAFGCTLWSIDTMFQLVNEGIAGVNWETSGGNACPPFWFTAPPNGAGTAAASYTLNSVAGQQDVNPLYYGMLLFQQATGNGAKLLPTIVSTPASANLVAWATVNTSGTPSLVLINKDETQSGTAAVTMPGYTEASVYLLTAPTFQSTGGVTYAGQSFLNSPDGTIQGTQAIETVQGNCGVFQIPMPITSAALVVFTQQAP